MKKTPVDGATYTYRSVHSREQKTRAAEVYRYFVSNIFTKVVH